MTFAHHQQSIAMGQDTSFKATQQQIQDDKIYVYSSDMKMTEKFNLNSPNDPDDKYCSER